MNGAPPGCEPDMQGRAYSEGQVSFNPCRAHFLRLLAKSWAWYRSNIYPGGLQTGPLFLLSQYPPDSPWPISFCLFVSALILCLLSPSRCQNLEQTARASNQIWVNRYSLKMRVAVQSALTQWHHFAYSTHEDALTRGVLEERLVPRWHFNDRGWLTGPRKHDPTLHLANRACVCVCARGCVHAGCLPDVLTRNGCSSNQLFFFFFPVTCCSSECETRSQLFGPRSLLSLGRGRRLLDSRPRQNKPVLSSRNFFLRLSSCTSYCWLDFLRTVSNSSKGHI